MEEMINPYTILVGNFQGKVYLEGLGVNGRKY
jgi:hypothetical protein